jgi:hypothetical protein
MRNIALILFAAWLLFGNGLSAVQSWLALPAVQAVPGTVATGLDRALTLPTAAVATPIAGVLQPQVPAAPIVAPLVPSAPPAIVAQPAIPTPVMPFPTVVATATPVPPTALAPIIIVTATPAPPTATEVRICADGKAATLGWCSGGGEVLQEGDGWSGGS